MNKWGSEIQADDLGKKDNTQEVNKQSPVEEVKNRIYFYSSVNKESILNLNSKIRRTANNLLVEQKSLGLEYPIPIYLHISSYGGIIFDGLSGMDEVKNSPVPVYTVIDGCCASAATFMSVAGKKRFINRHSYILIHQIQSVFWGNHQEFLDHMKNMKKFMKMIKAIYREHTKIPMKKLDEILKHDLWFDANEAINYGLVDEII